MNELSLFSGIGGGLLGTKLLGFNHIGYVEYNEYCQKVIAQRIKDGMLDKAPIFTDVHEFLKSGAARQYRGFTDVVTAGFPCQPFSVAGKQQGGNDERNMWPDTIAIIREVRPRYAFLENVPGLLAHEYARRIFGDLAESGFNVRWRVLSAAEMGAPHKRDRAWIVADNNEFANGVKYQHEKTRNNCKRNISELANTTIKFSDELDNNRKNSKCKVQQSGNSNSKNNFSDSNSAQCKGRIISKRALKKYPNTCWWDIEPGMDRVANGVAHRVDRLKATGNGQVSIVVKTAWELLND